MASDLIKVLFRKNLDEGMTAKYASIDAYDTVKRMKDEVKNGEEPAKVLADEGLEPDYIFDII